MPYADKGRSAEYYKEYYHANRDHRKQQQNARRAKLREQAFDVLGRTCVRCGFSDVRALQFDHINGGGGKERRELNDTHRYYKSIIEAGATKFQVLCANCNWIKRIEEDNGK